MRRFMLLAMLIISVTLSAGEVEHAMVGQVNGVKRIIIDGEPTLLVGGEVHNSGACTEYVMGRSLATLKSMGLDLALVPITWEQLEPEEGKFDDTLPLRLIDLAETHQMHVVVLWFGTWKNGESSYTPLYVKKNVKRYFRVKDENGENTTVISPFCEEAMRADLKALGHLLSLIKEKDTGRRIIAVQVENEIGTFTDLDYSVAGRKAYEKDVPKEFIDVLSSGVWGQEDEIEAQWISNGRKTQGSWSKVLGENDVCKQAFMGYAYAKYMQKLILEAKKIYDIPMFLNCWLSTGAPKFKTFPNGGPISKLINLYKSFAPAVDWLSPDVYDDNYKMAAAPYARKDNLFFIPETKTLPDRMFYSFAELNAQAVCPFAPEDEYADSLFTGSVKVLKELLPVISENQGKGTMHGFMRYGDEKGTEFDIGDYHFTVEYVTKIKNNFGMVIQTGEAEFLIAGMGSRVFINNRADPNRITRFTNVREVERSGNDWKILMRLNGDQTKHNGCVVLRGRTTNKPVRGIETPLTNISYGRMLREENINRFILPGIWLTDIYSIPKK